MLCSCLKVTSGRTGTRTYFENLPFFYEIWRKTERHTNQRLYICLRMPPVYQNFTGLYVFCENLWLPTHILVDCHNTPKSSINKLYSGVKYFSSLYPLKRRASCAQSNNVLEKSFTILCSKSESFFLENCLRNFE